MKLQSILVAAASVVCTLLISPTDASAAPRKLPQLAPKTILSYSLKNVDKSSAPVTQVYMQVMPLPSSVGTLDLFKPDLKPGEKFKQSMTIETQNLYQYMVFLNGGLLPSCTLRQEVKSSSPIRHIEAEIVIKTVNGYPTCSFKD